MSGRKNKPFRKHVRQPMRIVPLRFRNVHQLRRYGKDRADRRAVFFGFPVPVDDQCRVLQRLTRSGHPALDGSENRNVLHYRGRCQGRWKRRRQMSDLKRLFLLYRRTENQNPRWPNGCRNYVRRRRRRNVRHDRRERSAHSGGRRGMTVRNRVLFVCRRNRKHFGIRWQGFHGRTGRNVVKRWESRELLRLRRRRTYRRIRQYYVRRTLVRFYGCRRVLHDQCRILRRRRSEVQLDVHLD